MFTSTCNCIRLRLFICFFSFSFLVCRLKGVLICFSILRSTLCGSFVNFGVMKLYGDTALDDALNVFVKLLLSLPLKNLLVIKGNGNRRGWEGEGGNSVGCLHCVLCIKLILLCLLVGKLESILV